MSYDIFLVFNSSFEAKYKYQRVLNKYFESNSCYYIKDREEIIFPIKRSLFKKILIKFKIKKYKYDKVRVRFISKNAPQANIGTYNKFFLVYDIDDLDIVRIIAEEYERGENL